MLKKIKKSIICILDINFTLIKKNNCFLKVVCYNDNRGEYMKILENEKGFSLVELLAVLVILALLALLAGGTVMNIINKAEEQITTAQENAILSAAEKWSVDNSEKFDDTEGQRVEVGLDIVFVVDVSGSMLKTLSGNSTDDYTKSRYYAAVEAINGALEVLKSNPKSRISFVFYATGITYQTSLKDASSISYLSVTKKNYIKVSDKQVYVDGGTYTQGGIVTAGNILINNKLCGQIPVIIVLTDGDPTYGYSKFESSPLSYHDHNSTDSNTGNRMSKEEAWYLIRNSYLVRERIEAVYGSDMFLYTIGVGLDQDYIRFVLNPNEETLLDLKNSTTKLSSTTTTSGQLYTYITGKTGAYNYVTESFMGKMDTSDLNQYFREITNQVTDAAKVTQVCVTVKDLYDGGYLSSSDIKMADGEASSTYVLMSYNEPTNQYTFALAKTEQQENDCKKILEGSA